MKNKMNEAINETQLTNTIAHKRFSPLKNGIINSVITGKSD
jgi:hypothetical protein